MNFSNHFLGRRVAEHGCHCWVDRQEAACRCGAKDADYRLIEQVLIILFNGLDLILVVLQAEIVAVDQPIEDQAGHQHIKPALIHADHGQRMDVL